MHLKRIFMSKEGRSDTAGLYIHIPFCISKCSYCNFFSTTRHDLKKPLLNAICNEMLTAPGKNLSFDTIYIGGGTPSVLDPDEINMLIEKAKSSLNISSTCEITMEVNPGTADLEKLKKYKAAGVNRLIIGAQSFQKNNLKFLGRIHSEKEATLSIEHARLAGFVNIGIDFIYGIPGQTKTSWADDLKKAVKFQPKHISCYMLTYEPGTPIYIKKKQNIHRPMPESLISELFNTTIDYLGSNNYSYYEISNFALKKPKEKIDNRSKHNLKYWSFAPYKGIGPSAHSYIEPVRYRNVSDIKTYIKKIGSGKPAFEEKEVLSKEQQIIEAVYISLRIDKGLNIKWFNNKFGENFTNKFKEKISFLEKKGFIISNSNNCRLTKKGLLFHNSIATMLT